MNEFSKNIKLPEDMKLTPEGKEKYLEARLSEYMAKFYKEKITTKKINLKDLLKNTKYFTIVSYDNTTASNPIENDNKLRVISEKVSYNI
jgi:hypothetical protein